MEYLRGEITGLIHAQPGLYLRHEPDGSPAPLLVDVSRSGREYPAEYRSPLPFTTVHDNVSMYVDELWAGAPARRRHAALLLRSRTPGWT